MTFRMTTTELRKFRKTRKGAMKWALYHTFDPKKCENEITTIADHSREMSVEVWRESLREAKAADPQGMDDEHFYAAEVIMGGKGYYPPHFTSHAVCKTCGPILSPYPNESEVSECIFCRSGYTQETNQMMKEIQDDMDI